MREKKRWFVIYLIIGLVLGLFLVMVASFFVLRSFYQDNTLSVVNKETETSLIHSTVEMSETATILVYQLTTEAIQGYDIKKDRLVNRKLSNEVIVRDVYGHIIPITEIKLGDIIKIEVDSNNAQVFSISKSAHVQQFDRINGTQIDEESCTISTNDSVYKYTDQTMVLKSNGVRGIIGEVSPYDIVTMSVYRNVVWSLVINEEAGNIKIESLPTDRGLIHIDSSRMIPLEKVHQLIKVTPGKHKIIIELEGYKKMIQDIEVFSGKTCDVSLETLEKLNQ